MGWIGAEVTKNEFNDGKYHLELQLEDDEVVSVDTKDLNNDKDQSLPLLRNPPILEATEDLTCLLYTSRCV